MKQRITRERARSLLLAMTLVWLALALLHPHLPLPRRVFEAVVVLDITQSMDVEDMRLPVNEDEKGRGNDKLVSRLTFAKQALIDALPGMSCGSRLGVGVFTEYRSLLLLEPVEVCANASDLQESLRNIEGRMAWAGNSEVAKGLYWAMKLMRKQQNSPALLFFTDGHEAPPINADNRLAYQGQAGEVRGFVVGIGGSLPLPIPKRDPQGKHMGVWDATQVSQVSPYAQAHVSADPAPLREPSAQREANTQPPLTNRDGAAVSTMRTRAALLGATPGAEHLSAQRAGYLALLAAEVGMSYTSPSSAREVASLFSQAELSEWRWPQHDAAALFAALALMTIIAYTVLGINNVAHNING